MIGPGTRAILLAFLVLGVVGCASLGTDEGFAQIGDTISERLDQRIYWRQGGPEDKEVDAAITEMLAHELNADAAVQIALLNNRQLQAAYEDIGIAQANLVQAGLLRNPIFDAAATFPIGGGVVDLELALVQDFLDILAIPLRRRVAASQFEAAKLRVTALVMDQAADTRTAFYRLQGATQILEMRREVSQATAASLAAMARLHEAGNVGRLDLDTERLMNERAGLDLAAAALAVLGAREELNRLMGLWGADTAWHAAPRLPELPEVALELSGIEKSAIAASVDLAILRQDIETVATRAGVRNLEVLLGDLAAGGIAERDDREWEAGPSISLAIPLFDQGQARRAVSRAQLAQKLDQYYARAVEIRSMAREARQKLVSARQNVLRYRDVMLPLETRVDAQMQLQYNAMQIGVFELLVAKERQIKTGAGYVQALRNYWLGRAALGQILGGRPALRRATLGVPSGGSTDATDAADH